MFYEVQLHRTYSHLKKFSKENRIDFCICGGRRVANTTETYFYEHLLFVEFSAHHLSQLMVNKITIILEHIKDIIGPD